MKKWIVLLLSSLVLCTSAACSSETAEVSRESAVPPQETVSAPLQEEESHDVQETVNQTMEQYDFEGVMYAARNGTVLASYVSGDDCTLATPMPIGSVSKQFCAAAVLCLQEQGKLRIDDTLDKYFPAYAEGKKITLQQMLSMRSGIPNFEESLRERISVDKTDEENTAILKEWLFQQPLDFAPDSSFRYSNTNYFLLGNIVEQVSGQKYIDFLREQFLTPLGMNHTGSIAEMTAGGASYENIDLEPGLTKGAGDIIATAEDMTRWLNGLVSSKVISQDSFKAMTTNYSDTQNYGFGIITDLAGGIGHGGTIGRYGAVDYIDPDTKTTIFFSSSTVTDVLPLLHQLTKDIQGGTTMMEETLTEITLPYLDKDKKVRVYVPAHEEGDTLPVIYMTDGQNLFNDDIVQFGCWYTREAVREEQENGSKGAIIVGIHNDGEPLERANDLTPASIGEMIVPPEEALTEQEKALWAMFKPRGEAFGEFVVNTVMPEIEKQFPVKTGRESTAFCGSSSGGMESFYMAMNYPDKFSAAGVFSPVPFSMYYTEEDIVKWMKDKTAGKEQLPFLYFYAGGAEEKEQQICEGMEQLYEMLKAFYPSEQMELVTDPDMMHHESAWSEYFQPFLHRFLAD